MTIPVEVRRDRQRGCGFRKPGGLYLVSSGIPSFCGKLPAPLSVCPTCRAGIKPTRGWTWVDGDALLRGTPCVGGDCSTCRLSQPLGRVGLLWIGEQFYPMPSDWLNEARTQGVSRRISAVPKDFKLGATWVLVAHRKAIGGKFSGIFHAFKPTAVEFVVRGNETDEELRALEARGITPVRVERVDEQPALVGVH